MCGSLRSACWVAALLAAQAVSALAAAPDESPPRSAGAVPTAAPLRFRRVYAPARREQDWWPRGSARYVPVEAEEFERLVRAAEETAVGSPKAGRLSQAQYAAEYDGGDTLRGSLDWEIEHSGQSPTMLAVAPLSLALGAARWRDGQLPAEIGLADQGQSALLVSRSGELTATWSLRGRRDSDGQLNFRFDLPSCVASTLRLTVPRGMVPAASGGLVSLEREQDERQEFRILLGGQTSFTLRLPNQLAQAANQPSLLLRETTVYDLSSRGLDLATVWKLDVRAAPVRQLQLSLDAGLQLLSARLGEADVPFSSRSEPGGGASQVTLELPEPLTGSDRPLRLAAIAALPAETPWLVPRIRAADAAWQEGTCTLLVHEPLVTDSLVTHDCRQTKYSLLPEPNRGESFDLQLFSETATVQLALTRQKTPPRLSTGLSIELGDSEAHAELVAVMQVAGGRRSSIAADVAADWVIDGVAAEPRDALARWDMTASGESPRLTLHLARRAAADEPVKLVIHAHRSAAGEEPGNWRADDLVVLRFRGVDLDQQLLSLRPVPSRTLHIENAEGLTPWESDHAPTTLTTLFSVLPSDPVYRFDFARSRFTAIVDEQQPRFTAEIRGVASIDQDALSESYTIHCQPDDSRVAQLLVQFGPRSAQPVHFRLSGDGTGAAFARRLTAAEQGAKKLPATSEIWQVTLSAPRSDPFDIVADRVTPRAAEMPLGLLTLPEAISLDAHIAVEAPADERLSIRASGVTPVDVADGAAATTRAIFDYAANDATGQVTVLGDETALAPVAAALVWHRRVESRYDAAGRAIHRATFAVHNAGREDLALSVPENAEITRIWLDGQPQPVPRGGQTRVALSPQTQSSSLVVEYRSAIARFTNGSRLTATLAEVDLPILASDWLLWMPPGYQLLNVEGGTCEPVAAGFSWSQRLLGPLGRAVGGTEFDLFSARITRQADAAVEPAPDANGSPATASEPGRHSEDHEDDAEQSSVVVDPAPSVAQDGSASPYLIRCDGAGWPEVQILHSATSATLGVSACTLVLAACLCLVHRAEKLSALVALTAAAALVVPALMAPLATGCLWGVLLALVWRRLAPRIWPVASPPARSAAVSSVRRLTIANPTLLALIGLGSLCACGSLVAAQPAASETGDEAGQAVYRVFIPVDDDERPTKDKYQVPEQLYTELERRAGGAASAAEGYLIRKARYLVTINREAASDTLLPSDVLVQYEVLVLRPDVAFRLPTTAIRPGVGARRGGAEVELEWDTDEDGFACRFDEPGTYQLEIFMRPQRGEGAGGSLDIAIPPVPSATLDVQLPPIPPTIEVPSACGASTLSADGRKLAADLGPAERLQVRWARARPVRAATASGDADVRLWLQIQPASVTLHARLELTSLKTPLTELTLSVDPRLRPLPVVDRSGTVASVQSVVGDPQTIRVELARPVQDHVTIPVSFLLTGSSGVGQLTLPRIAPQGVREQKRTLAISVDPALQYEVAAPDAKTTIPASEFLAHWGGAPAAPQLALRLGVDEPFSIATRPREPTTSIKQRLDISVGEHRASVRFDAQITPVEGQIPSAGQALQYRLAAPADLHIDKISLLQDRIDRVSRWSRDEQGGITVFVAGPAAGRQQLTVEGWMPVADQESWPLPTIDLRSAGHRDTTILVLRQPDVRIALASQHGLVEIDRPRVQDEPMLPGRVVAALLARQDDFAASLRIAPNAPHTRSVQVTTIARESGAWQGRIDYRSTVEDGCLDAIVFKLPAEWIGPFEIMPPAAQEILPGPGNDRRLVVHPKVAIEGDYQLTLRSPLGLNNEEQPILPPALVLAGGEETASYLRLPIASAGERLAWNTSGMHPAQLPEDSTPPSSSGDYSVFRIKDPAASAWPTHDRASTQSAGTGADIRVRLSPNGPISGIATFFINEPKAATCRLDLPEGLEIVELRRSGLPITPERDGNGWRISLAGGDSRETIEVAFRGEPLATSFTGWSVLDAPSLTGIDIARTDWRVYGTALTAEARPVDAADSQPLAARNRDATGATEASSAAPFGDSLAGHWSFAGSAPSLALRFSPRFPDLVSWRWLAAVLLAAVGLAWAAGRGPLAPLVAGWPAAGMLVGLLMSAWATPAWLGVLVVAACLLAAYGRAIQPWFARAGQTSGEPAAT